MTKEEYLKELNKAFGDFKFFSQDHHYEYKGKRVGISVTRFIEQYCNEFDAQAVAEKVATKNKKNYDYATVQLKYYNPLVLGYDGCREKYDELQEMLKQPTTVQEVLNEWDYKNKFACAKGSTCHEYAQSLWSGNDFDRGDFDGSKEYLQAVDKIESQADRFYNDYQDRLEHLADEFVVGSSEYVIARAIDHLFINQLTGGLVLVDYKTNSDIHKTEKYAKDMKVPLQHLKDFTLNHYYIQLSIYKYLVEKYTNLKIEEMFIVYFSENIENYEIIEIPYLYEEVRKILELRRANKMAKMLLIIGEGGSGKTSSLKNLSPEEHFYIDCDKKGLNYKGWKNDYIEKKNYFKTNDGEIVAKLLHEISNNKPQFKYVTIDTINSIMIADEMKRMKVKSYNEWQDLAKCIFDLIDIVPDLRDDLTVIFIGHTQTEEDGFIRLLTNGRKLNKIGLEKYFNTVLLSKAKDGEYIFETRANNSTARTPMGAFDELEIPNDITKVLEVIKEY